MLHAGLLHDVKITSLVSAFRAQDLKEETKRLTVMLKFKKGNAQHTDLVFKDVKKDEYTLEELPMVHVRLAMKEGVFLRQGMGRSSHN